jgi:hypothetical protein
MSGIKPQQNYFCNQRLAKLYLNVVSLGGLVVTCLLLNSGFTGSNPAGKDRF